MMNLYQLYFPVGSLGQEGCTYVLQTVDTSGIKQNYSLYRTGGLYLCSSDRGYFGDITKLQFV